MLDAPHAVSYRMTYVEVATGKTLVAEYQTLAEDYAEKLQPQAPKSQLVSRALMAWHLERGEAQKALDAALALPGVRRLDPTGWDDAFLLCGLLMEDAATAPQARQAAGELAARYNAAQAEALAPIALSDEARQVYDFVD